MRDWEAASKNLKNASKDDDNLEEEKEKTRIVTYNTKRHLPTV